MLRTWNFLSACWRVSMRRSGCKIWLHSFDHHFHLVLLMVMEFFDCLLVCVSVGSSHASGRCDGSWQLQQALEALQSSSASSPELPSQPETSITHHPPPNREAIQQPSPSFSRRPSDANLSKEASVDPNLAASDPFPTPSPNPISDSPELNLPPASAGVGAWNPWADDLNHRSSSSPHYQPGSSDSDWDDPDLLRDHPDHPDSAQDPSPAPRDFEQDQGEFSGTTTAQTESPRAASAMAEAQHRLDQLIGLAASHGELEQTLASETDLGYAWGLVDDYIQHLQRQVRAAALQCAIGHLHPQQCLPLLCCCCCLHSCCCYLHSCCCCCFHFCYCCCCCCCSC